jgi:hypothetical protein
MMLALKLGRTLEELTNSMSSAEFNLWLELYQENDWGEKRAYERAGIIAATIGNYAGMMRDKNARPLKPADFMPYAQPEPESEPDPIAYFKAVAATHGK